MLTNLILALSVVLPLFINIMLGYGVKLSGLVKESSFLDLNKLTFNVLFPILIFNGIYSADINSFLNFRLMLTLVIITAIIFIYGQITARFIDQDVKTQAVVSHSMFRTNFLIIGLPILVALYGASGAAVGFLLVAISNPIFNPLSVLNFEMFHQRKIKVKNILKNLITSPLNVATILGFIFLLLDIKLPLIINTTLTNLASLAPTLALIILGGTLRLKAMANFGKAFTFTLINRLIIIPAILIAGLLMFNFSAVEVMALVIFFATPVAVISLSFTIEYEANKELASALIVFSTLLSAFSLVAIVTILQTIL